MWSQSLLGINQIYFRYQNGLKLGSDKEKARVWTPFKAYLNKTILKHIPQFTHRSTGGFEADYLNRWTFGYAMINF